VRAVNMRLIVKGHPYPMPATHEVFFETESIENELAVQFQICSAEGHILASGLAQNQQGLHRIDTADLSPGSYLLRIDDGSAVRSFPLLIVR
jgi:hypothetical protein